MSDDFFNDLEDNEVEKEDNVEPDEVVEEVNLVDNEEDEEEEEEQNAGEVQEEEVVSDHEKNVPVPKEDKHKKEKEEKERKENEEKERQRKEKAQQEAKKLEEEARKLKEYKKIETEKRLQQEQKKQEELKKAEEQKRLEEQKQYLAEREKLIKKKREREEAEKKESQKKEAESKPETEDNSDNDVERAMEDIGSNETGISQIKKDAKKPQPKVDSDVKLVFPRKGEGFFNKVVIQSSVGDIEIRYFEADDSRVYFILKDIYAKSTATNWSTTFTKKHQKQPELKIKTKCDGKLEWVALPEVVISLISNAKKEVLTNKSEITQYFKDCFSEEFSSLSSTKAQKLMNVLVKKPLVEDKKQKKIDEVVSKKTNTSNENTDNNNNHKESTQESVPPKKKLKTSQVEPPKITKREQQQVLLHITEQLVPMNKQLEEIKKVIPMIQSLDNAITSIHVSLRWLASQVAE